MECFWLSVSRKFVINELAFNWYILKKKLKKKTQFLFVCPTFIGSLSIHCRDNIFHNGVLFLLGRV